MKGPPLPDEYVIASPSMSVAASVPTTVPAAVFSFTAKLELVMVGASSTAAIVTATCWLTVLPLGSDTSMSKASVPFQLALGAKLHAPVVGIEREHAIGGPRPYRIGECLIVGIDSANATGERLILGPHKCLIEQSRSGAQNTGDIEAIAVGTDDGAEGEAAVMAVIRSSACAR